MGLLLLIILIILLLGGGGYGYSRYGYGGGIGIRGRLVDRPDRLPAVLTDTSDAPHGR